MKVVSTNIAQARTLTWKGKEVTTGIYKIPIQKGIFLTKNNVAGDHVADSKHHGGTFKSCYLFSCAEYAFWKRKYPNLDWDWGMFGENLSIDTLDEERILVGSQYRLGEALVEATLPREPCYKLGIRMGTQDIISEFIDRERPGVYLRVIEEGKVKEGDELTLTCTSHINLSIADLYRILYRKEKNKELQAIARVHPAIPDYKKEVISRFS